MKKLLVLLLLVGGAVWFVKNHKSAGSLAGAGASDESPEGKARQRLEQLMESWKKGGTSLNDAEQAASCLWARGKIFIVDREDLKDAVDGFDKFRRVKNLYTDINSYKIADGSTRRTEDGRGTYTIFEVTINGSAHRLGVPDRPNPLFWLD